MADAAGAGRGRARTGRMRRAWLLLPAAVLLLMLLGIGGVVLGQSADISLNSPVSFPVDI